MTEYRAKCVGRLLHFLADYTWKAEEWVFSYDHERDVGLIFDDPGCKGKVAEYTWDEPDPQWPDQYVPTFKFFGTDDFVAMMERTQAERKQQVVDRERRLLSA